MDITHIPTERGMTGFNFVNFNMKIKLWTNVHPNRFYFH